MKAGKLCRGFVVSSILSTLSPLAFGAQIDLASIKLPWKNAADQGSILELGKKPNTVFVFEAYSLGCHWCNVNAPKVQEMAKSYSGNERVQFIDLGLDTREIDYTRWISTHKPSYPVVQDMDGKIFSSLKQGNGIPQTFVVDCQGNLVVGTLGSWGEGEQEVIKNGITKAEETVCND
jgi:hypothetical protein